MTISLALDIIIAMLLVLTIIYAIRLNSRLGLLRKDKSALQVLAKTFSEATGRAEDGIRQLQVSTDALKIEIQKAEVLKDDLIYLIERGGASADEMMERVNVVHKAPSLGAKEMAAKPQGTDFGFNDISPRRVHPASPSGRIHSPESDAERVLMKVLGTAG